jgi:branched-subunit amino acid aminotransferase/4-amino-4-deoxychorismate lyase
LNGRFIPAAELTIPAYDAGFVLGATVSEQLRTFGGKLYKLDEHLARLRRGLEITTIDADCTVEQLAAWAKELAAANHKLLDPADDLGLSIFITPGPYATLAPPDVPKRATIGMSTYPLPFHLWAEKYETGEHLVVSTVRQVSADSWPRELKCRSRMHYYLAEQDVRRRAPGARPLLLDEFGFVNETPTANVVAVLGDEFVMPPQADTLSGVSLASINEYSTPTGMLFMVTEQPLTLDRLRSAAEVILCSTPFCLLPVVKLDDAPIGDGRPGPVYRKLLEAWSGDVGVDIAAQAKRFAQR